MSNDIQNLLKDFYQAIIFNHREKTDKMQSLDCHFSKLNIFPDVRTEIRKENKDSEYQTLASIGDINHFWANGQKEKTFSSCMLYTFLPVNQQNKLNCSADNDSKTTFKQSFTDFSFLKVLLYAIFINFLKVSRRIRKGQNSQHLDKCLSFSQRMIKKIKVAMVSSAQSYKATLRSKYNKIRYLYDQLIYYTEKDSQSRQDYIKIIIQQFDEDFVQSTFGSLRPKNSELGDSFSMDEQKSQENQLLGRLDVPMNIQKIMEYLKVKLTLTKDDQNVQMNGKNFKIQILIEQMPNGAFRLNQIIPTPTSMETLIH